jgi:hypothetical protein
VAQASSTPVQQVEDHFRVAQRAHIVRPEASGEYILTHDLIRETLLLQLGPARRQSRAGECVRARAWPDARHLTSRGKEIR